MSKIRRAQHFLCLLLAVMIISCAKDANLVVTSPPLVDSSASIRYTGTFSNGPYGTVSGNVQVLMQDSVFALSLKNFSTSSGPDLHVYLSKQIRPLDFFDLGSLRTTRGDQLYTIPANTDFTQYKYALIHCKAYNHLFGSALLQ